MRSKKTLINIATSLLLQIVVIISSFIVPKLIISEYGSDVNGLISSITQFLAYISLLESGIGPVIKSALYKPLAKKDKKEIGNIIKASENFFKSIGIIFIFYLIILCFLYPLIINKEFDSLFTISLILIISISTFFEYFFGLTYQLYLESKQEGYVISFLRIGTYILNIIATIILVRFNTSVQIVKLISGLIFIIRPIFTNLYVKNKYKIDLNDTDNNYKLSKKWDGLAQHIAAIIHNNTDTTVLTIFTKLSEVSVYSVYFMVVSGIKKIVQSFTGGIDALFGDMLAKDETELLNKSFSTYEFIYFTIITIFYTCTMILIVPFVSVYTKNITDANYIRPIFAVILTLSEFAWSIRLPYSSITLAAGHFKETRKGAWIESISNIVISVILVIKYGIVGVAIGTLLAMIIRTIEFVYHTNKYILNRNILINIKKIILIVIEVLISVFVTKIIPVIKIINYITWIEYAIIVFVIVTLITFTINSIVYKEDLKNVSSILKKNKKRGNR